MALSFNFAIVFMIFLALPLSFSMLEGKSINTTAPRINFTITDHNGHDVTSSFKVMLYEQPETQNKSDLNDRQVEFVRPIDTCGDTEGIFLDSTCNHRDQVRGSLQAYTYHCLTYGPNSPPPGRRQRSVLTFYGECEDDELCVNGIGIDQFWHERTHVAHCVQSKAYVDLTDSNTTQESDKASTDSRLDATMSEADQKTPLKADSISIEAEASAFGGAKGSVQRRSCVNCVELTTDKFAPQTDVLETDVQLATTGMAAAGILWLTLLTG